MIMKGTGPRKSFFLLGFIVLRISSLAFNSSMAQVLFLVSNGSITVAPDMDGKFIGESIPNAVSSSLNFSKSAGLIKIIIDTLYSNCCIFFQREASEENCLCPFHNSFHQRYFKQIEKEQSQQQNRWKIFGREHFSFSIVNGSVLVFFSRDL